MSSARPTCNSNRGALQSGEYGMGQQSDMSSARPTCNSNRGALQSGEYGMGQQVTLGCPDACEIPLSLRQGLGNGLLPLIYDSSRKVYRDYNCLFRCIVLARSKVKSHAEIPVDLDQQADLLRIQYLEHTGRNPIMGSVRRFVGIPFEDLAFVEQLFAVEINVYIQEAESQNPSQTRSRRRRRSGNVFIDDEAMDGSGEEESDFGDGEVDFESMEEAAGVALDSDSEADDMLASSSASEVAANGDQVEDNESRQPDEQRRLVLRRRGTPQTPRGQPVNVLWCNNHAMYILSTAKIGMSSVCGRCGQVFAAREYLTKHIRDVDCVAGPRKVYTRNGYEPEQSLFEALQSAFPEELVMAGRENDLTHEAIRTSTTAQLHITRAMQLPLDCLVFDAETYARPVDESSGKSTVVNDQIPYYIGLAYQFSEHTPDGYDDVVQQDFPGSATRYRAFTNPDPYKLVVDFVEALVTIQAEFEELRRQRYAPLLEFLTNKVHEAETAREHMKQPVTEGGLTRFKHYDALQKEVQQLFVKLAHLRRETTRDEVQIQAVATRVGEITHQFRTGHIELGRTAVLSGRVDEFRSLLKRLEDFCSNLMCVGFNSSRFDLHVLKRYLFPALQARGMLHPKLVRVIQKGSAFVMLAAEHLHFYDITNFLAPGQSYQKFLTAMDIEEAKSIFPHGIVDSYERLLEERPFPCMEDFHSDLTGVAPVPEEYENTKRVYEERGFKCLLDLVGYYLKFDTIPFVTAVRKYMELWHSFGANLFGDGVMTLPGLALKQLFRFKDETAHFAGIPDSHSWFREDLIRGIVGGPSCIFSRRQVVGETNLRPGARITKQLLGYDANSLYLWAIAQPMPIGPPLVLEPSKEVADPFPTLCRAVRYPYNADEAPIGVTSEQLVEDAKKLEAAQLQHRRTQFRYKEMVPYSRNEALYGDALHAKLKAETQQQLKEAGVHKDVCIPKVRHAMTGQQLRLKSITGAFVYCDAAIGSYVFGELHGCVFHNHNCSVGQAVFAKASVENAAKMLYSRWWTDVKQHFLNTVALIRADQLYECELRRLQNDVESAEFRVGMYHDPDASLAATKIHRQWSGGELEERIKAGKLHGFVKASVMVHHTNAEQRRRLEQLPPIFKNYSVTPQNFDLPERRAQMEEILKRPRRVLLPSYYGEAILLHTDYLRELLSEYDAVVVKIFYIVQFASSPCFNELKNAVWRNRAEATMQGDLLRALVYKLLGNSCYGKTITNIDRHTNVTICDAHTVTKFVNNKRFLSLNPVGENFYEVKSRKRKLVYDLPCVIGCTVYNFAKLNLLDFCYKFLDRFLLREDWSLTSCDTDSLYFGIAEDTVDACVERRARVTGDVDLLSTYRTCGLTGKAAFIANVDGTTKEKMEPGKYKLEWSGTHYIGLQPKVGLMLSKDEDGRLLKQKSVVRGCKQQQNPDKIGWDLWQRTLESDGVISVSNVNFRVRAGGVSKVIDRRDCMGTYLVKAVVQSDGTTVLPIVSDFRQPENHAPSAGEDHPPAANVRLDPNLFDDDSVHDGQVVYEDRMDNESPQNTNHMSLFDVGRDEEDGHALQAVVNWLQMEDLEDQPGTSTAAAEREQLFQIYNSTTG